MILREYTKLFTGTNQNVGYDKPFLGFDSDTEAITLKADKSTYFHFPKYIDSIALSATDLSRAGAFAGLTPYKSDKIYKMMYDYESDTPYGNPLPENQQKGVWLCAWLSGNAGADNAIWMDRWAKSYYFDSSFSVFISASGDMVYDEPSTMTFDPGCYYRYDHIGNDTIDEIISYIRGEYIHIDNWNETSYNLVSSNDIKELKIYNYTNDVLSDGVNSADFADDSSIELNGTNQYAQILYDKTFNEKNNISLNCWIRSNNWQEQKSHHIISNGLRGGWSIGYNNGYFTPYSVLIDSNGDVVFLNQEDVIYKNIKIVGTPNIVSFGVDSELFVWVADNGLYNSLKHIYKIDYNGSIENFITFESKYEIKDLKIDKDNNILVLAYNTDNDQQISYIFKYNADCVLVDRTVVDNYTKILIANNVASVIEAKEVFNFLDSNVYIDLNNDVYYNNISTGIKADNIACVDNILVVIYNNVISKYVASLNALISQYEFSLETTIGNAVGNVHSVYFSKQNTNNILYVYTKNSDYIYKYNDNLNFIKKVSLANVQYDLTGNPINGDSAGFIWNHDFNYINLEKEDTPQVEANVYMTNSILNGTYPDVIEIKNTRKYTLKVPVDNLTLNEWHMITFNIDTKNNILSLYVDTILEDSMVLSGTNTIYYRYETPLILGCNVGKTLLLDEEIESTSLRHLGGFADLRIYCGENSAEPYCLDEKDLLYIYLTRFKFRDIKWHMPIHCQSYVEEIVKFMKLKMPGSKSQFYNIYLKNLQITDEDTRNLIEDIIKENVEKIVPAYAKLLKIIWDQNEDNTNTSERTDL